MARNATDESSGFLRGQRYLLHDRDTKFCAAFLDVLRSSGIRPLTLPPKSPNLNAFAERWVGSIRQEWLSKLILFGEASLRRALNEYLEHYHFERNHQSYSLLQMDRFAPKTGQFTVAIDSAVCSGFTPEPLDSLTTRGSSWPTASQFLHVRRRLTLNSHSRLSAPSETPRCCSYRSM